MIRIERMTSATRAHVDSMQRLLFPPPNGLANLDHGQWWVAFSEDRDELAGFCAIQASRTLGTAYLSRAGVMPKFRGHGLQRRMVHLRMKWAKANGFKFVVTDTTSNPASANSLINCGFKLYDPAHKWAFPDSLYWRKQCA